MFDVPGYAYIRQPPRLPINSSLKATPEPILTGRSSRRAECPKNQSHGPVWTRTNARVNETHSICMWGWGTPQMGVRLFETSCVRRSPREAFLT